MTLANTIKGGLTPAEIGTLHMQCTMFCAVYRAVEIQSRCPGVIGCQPYADKMTKYGVASTVVYVSALISSRISNMTYDIAAGTLHRSATACRFWIKEIHLQPN